MRVGCGEERGESGLWRVRVGCGEGEGELWGRVMVGCGEERDEGGLWEGEG